MTIDEKYTKGKKDRIWYDTVGYDVSFHRRNGKILHL
jgi:hypothetical protein